MNRNSRLSSSLLNSKCKNNLLQEKRLLKPGIRVSLYCNREAAQRKYFHSGGQLVFVMMSKGFFWLWDCQHMIQENGDFYWQFYKELDMCATSKWKHNYMIQSQSCNILFIMAASVSEILFSSIQLLLILSKVFQSTQPSFQQIQS